MSETRARCERRDKLRNHERVLDAARELLAEHGATVTMEEVARRAGVGVGTIYRRFPSKDHLLAAVSSAACRDVSDRLAEAMAPAAPPLEKLRALVRACYRDGCHREAALGLRPAELEVGCWDGAGRPVDLYGTLHAAVRGIIAEGQAAGAVRPGDPAVMATLCLELLTPRALQNLQLMSDVADTALADEVADFLIRGLSPRPEAP